MEWISMDDGTRLYLRRWSDTAASKPRAAVHIVHGMAEHSGRYSAIARSLVSEGIEVWAADMRGHGKTALEGGNDPGRGGLLGHCADSESFTRVCSDIDAINRTIMKERPGVPLFLMGHSWGSFLVQYYIESYECGNAKDEPLRLAGCILSGSRGKGGPILSLGFPLLAFISFIKGKRRGSSLSRAIVDGPYSRPFKPRRTMFDWLSRDNAEVDAYINDPSCGKLCSSGFYRDLVLLLKTIHREEQMKRIRADLPIYIFSGSADPVGEMGESPNLLAASYRGIGVKDLELVLYPEARHEPLHETNREEVTASLVSWLLRHTDTSNL